MFQNSRVAVLYFQNQKQKAPTLEVRHRRSGSLEGPPEFSAGRPGSAGTSGPRAAKWRTLLGGTCRPSARLSKGKGDTADDSKGVFKSGFACHFFCQDVSLESRAHLYFGLAGGPRSCTHLRSNVARNTSSRSKGRITVSQAPTQEYTIEISTIGTLYPTGGLNFGSLYGRDIYQMPHFPMVWERKTPKMKCHSHHIKGICCPLITLET
ncbi:uncharacterized protein LOC125102022 [Lutra lutra]|uniref:uncharacterized protein LOC125102022 n=1 Tax=Lutra lutra TaxID=9657 RepID=UPI001FD2B9CB|nr:uncharacterized protein LOC125102022 [Lutra lutra]